MWVLTAATLGLTLLPQENFQNSDIFQYDKVGHFLIFGVWTFLLGLALHLKGQRPLPYLAIFLAGSLFGLTIEVLQETLPVNRNMSFADWIADSFGSLMAVLLLRQWLNKKRDIFEQ
ncbi:MAG: VanZ family protein [Bacteroidota bacterium]